MNWLEHRARAIEFAVAGWLTLFAGAIHLLVVTHAGPLWRDEISSLTLATMPTLQKFWSALVFDPCPAFFFLVLRAWNGIGLGGNDFALRVLGLLIGLLIIAALWWSCWRINRTAPILPLAIFALHPVTFQFGDSLRAYGLAVLFITLAFAAIWDLTFRPLRLRAVLFAGLVAVLSVQTLTTNSLMLFAICTAGLTISFARKEWPRFFSILLTATAAAFSLLIYLPIFRHTHQWSMLCVEPTTYGNLLASYGKALSEGGPLAFWSWIAVAGSGVTAALIVLVRGKSATAKEDRQSQILFAAIALVVGTVAFLIFFREISWPTSSWYFLPLMAVSILSLHIFIGTALPSRSASIAAIVLALFSLFMVPSTASYAFVRRTNADLVAAIVAQRIGPQDFVIVNPYFYAVSFQRYYHGSAPWTALPSVEDYSLHRWDLLKRAMETPDAVQNILQRAQETLASGHTVYLVGGFPPGTVSPPEPLARAPHPVSGWSFQAYVRNWAWQTSYVVYHNRAHAIYFEMNENVPVSSLEHLRVIAVTGRAPSIATAP